jgi:hypothetical protein
MIGRITVIKTLILPQVAFIGTILNPPENWADKLNSVCEKFVLGTDKISKTKLYIPPKLGGIGLINIGDFLTALKCTWLKKALVSTDDNWKITIRTVTDNFTNFANISGWGEVIENIIGSVQIFKKRWVLHENNFLKANLIDNSNFGYGTNQVRIFDREFFTTGTGFDENIHIMLRFLCWDNLTSGGVFESRANVSNTLGFELPHDKYQSLKLGYTRAVKNFFTVGGVNKDFLEFFRETKNCNLSKKNLSSAGWKTSTTWPGQKSNKKL